MGFSSLPAYSKAKAPAAPSAPSRRGATMLLRVLCVLVFWIAIYVVHQHVTALLRSRQEVREREQMEREREAALEQIAGRWISIHGDNASINFVEDRFVFRREYTAVPRGYLLFKNGTYILKGYDFEEDWFARLVDDELEIECGEYGQKYFEKRKLPWHGVWRFRRPNE
jgi:hypothetical protein